MYLGHVHYVVSSNINLATKGMHISYTHTISKLRCMTVVLDGMNLVKLSKDLKKYKKVNE